MADAGGHAGFEAIGPGFFAASYTSRNMAGESVAQLMKILPFGTSEEVIPCPEVDGAWASFVMTVKMTSAAAVTSASFVQALQPSSAASSAAARSIHIEHGGDAVSAFFEATGHVGPHFSDSDKGNCLRHEDEWLGGRSWWLGFDTSRACRRDG
jgi:hypothetical protein